MSHKVLVMGQGHLAEAALKGLLGKFPVSILSEDKELSRWAERHSITVLRRPPSGKKARDYTLIVLAGFQKRIAADVAKTARILNIHGSLLPKYRGLHSVAWAMLNGDSKIGVSFHQVDEFIDHGPIFTQFSLDVRGRTAKHVLDGLDKIVQARIAGAVRGIVSGRLVAREQNHGKATFTGRRSLDDCRLDWRTSSELMERILRTLTPPYPRPFFDYKGKRYEIVVAEVLDRKYVEIPGHIVYVDNEGVYVKILDGLLLIKSLAVDGQVVAARDVFSRAGVRLA